MMKVNDYTPLNVFVDVQDILFYDLPLDALGRKEEYWDVLGQAWGDIHDAVNLFNNGEAFSPLSMLTSVRGHGNVSTM